MATGGGSYSFSLTTFSPSGKLVQIEHALAAVGQGTSSLGIKASNGVVIATEKKTASILVDDSIIEKVASICPNIGMVYSGMGPDYRVLVTRARKIAQAYWKWFLFLRFMGNIRQHGCSRKKSPRSCRKLPNQGHGVRPFGVSLLIAGWDEHRGSTLYQVDPSGSFWPWKASAIGKNMVNAKTFLEKRQVFFLSKLNWALDAIHTAILTLKEGFEGQMTEKTIEIGVMGTVGVGADTVQPADRAKPVFRKLTEAEVKDFLAL
ncbi:proteasome subunit alpha type [Puccinia sorghi]|uniref:Proteasome subunit alpha type n=1 Tax=Puccinia sorghi TaxID=27349 RepID=A0A0L6USJ8_9BASI|nr:proteasome subunit alpha type [Puccinia sorghi]